MKVAPPFLLVSQSKRAILKVGKHCFDLDSMAGLESSTEFDFLETIR
jgi:hypothetical protein